MLGGGGGGAGLGLDFSAVIQAAVVGLVLFTAAVAAVRRAASRYFVVDAAGFAAASYDDDHHPHHGPREYRLMPPQVREQQQQPMAQGQGQAPAGGEVGGPCAECGRASTKKCSGCKRMRYCSGECQSKHWQSDHKNKCKQMKLLNPLEKLTSGGEANSKKSSGSGCISLVPGPRKSNKVIFPYDEFLKLYNWKDCDLLPCGLVNCGNSCFANVVLQCLSCTRPLVAYLLGKDHNRHCYLRHEDWCFLCELQSHIQRATDSSRPFAPMNILSHLPNIGGNLGSGRQEDAHEFMSFAIAKMQSACLDAFGGEKAVDLSTQETTIIQHIFGGRLQSQVECTACGMVSNRYEKMMDLTVEIQGDAESVEECLNQFTAIEWLDGDNKYECNRCHDYVKARKRLTVHEAPNILIITLKRFQSGRFGKLNKRITFPTKLDLAPYMNTPDGNDQYDLYAVIVHLDMLNASFFGHYICYMKDCQGHWYKIDDCKVMRVDEEEVHAQGAYMLLYSRITARPRPLLSAEELTKQQQLCNVPPSNGQNHVLPEDVSLNCESFSMPSEDLQADSESSNLPLHEMDIMDQESELDLGISNERDKFTTNGNLHLPVSSGLHDLGEATRGQGCSLGGSTTMRSEQLGNSACISSSAHSSGEQCKDLAPCSDSVDYMDIDTEAGTEVVGRNEQQQPVLPDSVGVIGKRTSAPTFNGIAGKPKPLFSRGFLDKPSRKKSPLVEDDRIGESGAAFSQKLNGHCNEHFSVSEQWKHVLGNSSGGSTSSGSAQCNGGVFPTSSNGKYSVANGDTVSTNVSLHAENRDMPSISNGFYPRPYKESSGSKANGNNTTNGEPFLDSSKYSGNSPANVHKEDLSFLPRGFLERPCSREKIVKSVDSLPVSNGTLSSFANGNSKSNNNSLSRGSKCDMGSSPEFLTMRCRESVVMDTSAGFTHDWKTSSNILEQESLSAAASPDQIQESSSSDHTTNGTALKETAAFDSASGHRDENGLAIPDRNGSSYQRDDASAMLVCEKVMGSENADHLKSMLDHDGLRRRATSKYFEQRSVDAQ